MKVGELAAKSVNITVDLIAVVDNIAEPETITLKTGEQKKKTSLYLMDDTEYTVKVDIWGDNDTLSSLQPGQLVILKKGIVREFKNEKNVSFSYSSKLVTDIPKIDRVNELIAWRSGFNKANLKNLKGEATASTSTSEVKTLD